MTGSELYLADNSSACQYAIKNTHWWLGYYIYWNQYIRSRYSYVEENQRIIAFDLRTIDEYRYSSLADRKNNGVGVANRYSVEPPCIRTCPG
jgi:hypothetical protein